MVKSWCVGRFLSDTSKIDSEYIAHIALVIFLYAISSSTNRLISCIAGRINTGYVLCRSSRTLELVFHKCIIM